MRCSAFILQPVLLSLAQLVLALPVVSLSACHPDAASLKTHQHSDSLGHSEHLRQMFEQHGINLPSSFYDEAGGILETEEQSYDGRHVPACLDRSGSVLRFDGTQARVPGDGELLTIVAGDPAIKDRSLSALADHWQPYLDADFRYDCQLAGLSGPQMCSPVTYFYEYRDWNLRRGGGSSEPEPPPHLFVYIPSHPAFDDGGATQDRFREIFDRMEAVRAIVGQDARLKEMHKLISWLKGDARITTIAGAPVRAMLNNHVSGMGKLFLPAMAFRAAPGGLLPEPSFAVAIPDAMRKLMSQNPDFSKTYEANFRVGQSLADHRAFVSAVPFSGLYEDLRYTDDPLTISGFNLAVDAAQGQNTTPGGGHPGQVLRGLLYSSGISTQRDSLGRPLLNGHVQRPPSGVCLEEAAFFMHTSMLHTWDGWGLVGWNRASEMMTALTSDFMGPSGICATWNSRYQGYAEKLTAPCVLPAAHVELYDSHIFIPHGRIDIVRQRLTELEQAYASGVQSAASWAALGYKVPDNWPCTQAQPCATNPCATIQCTEDNLRLLSIAECGSDPSCQERLGRAFQSAYMGVTTRLLSGLSPAHVPSLEPTRSNTQAMWDDRFAESVRDTLACRAAIDDVIVDTSCQFVDVTPIPDTGYGKSALPGEPLLYMFNHLWTYGAMQPIHEPGGLDRHLPRYHSNSGQNDPSLVGLVSYHSFLGSSGYSYPAPESYGAAWFVTDLHGYFREELPSLLGTDGRIDLTQLVRVGRGDPMYQLQHTPERLLGWTADPSRGCNLPDPSYPR